MLKKVVLSVFIGFIVFVLGVGYGFVNLKSNSVYYAQRTPHKAGVEPVLMEVTRNLDWIHTPDIKGITYGYHGNRSIYNNNVRKGFELSLSWFSDNTYYYDSGEKDYEFNRNFAFTYVMDNGAVTGSEKISNLSQVKRDIYRVVQPVIDAQPEPLINLQWIYDWVNKDRFN